MPHTTFAAPIALLLDVFRKSLPVFALAGLASLALRRASSARRHALWLLTLAALLCLPAFCAWLPRWAAPVLPAAAPRLAAPVPREQARVVTPPAVPPAQTAPASVASAPVILDTAAPAMTDAPVPPPAPAVTTAPVRRAATARPVTAAQWVCLAWLIGASLVTGRTLLGLVAASRLTRRCRVVTVGPLAQAADAARQAIGLTRPLSIRVGPVAVPMTCGVARPVVLLPEGATDWPAGRLRAVLLHEAAHVQRFDWATMLLARCACALYWPHPLVWLAVHRLRVEAEGACDDRVLTHGGIPAPDYAAHLLEIVRALSSRRAPPIATVAMASRPEVSARLRTILDTQQARGGITRRGLAVAALGVLGTVAATAAVHPVARKAFTAAPAAAATWTTLLPGGARADLVGVDAYSPVTKRTVELTPDGTARTGGLHPGWQFLRGAMAALPQSEGVNGSYDYFIVQADTTVSYDVGSTHIVPRGDGRGDVSITTATGSYGKLLVVPLERTVRRVLPRGGTLALSVNVPRFADWTGRHYAVTQVTVTAPSGYLDIPGCVLLPSLANGRPVSVPVDRFDADHDTPQRFTCYFRTSALQAKHVRGFQFLWRPVHTLVFRDIALRPAASASFASPTPRPAAQTKPGDQARFLAGLTAVQGPGVVVTLNNSRKQVPANMRVPGIAPPSLIHDTDINIVVSELKAAGAEAIAVNDQRLVAVSPIRSAGATVLVNSAALTPPYVVRAIGDPAQLQAAINLPGGVAEQIRAFDPAMIRVQASPQLTLPAYRGGLPNRYARPVASIGMRPRALPAPSGPLLPTPQFPQLWSPVADFQSPLLGGGSLAAHTLRLPLMQTGPHMMVVTMPTGRRFAGLLVTPPENIHLPAVGDAPPPGRR